MSLASALPKSGGDYKKTEWHLSQGEHKGYFIGLSEPIEESSIFSCKTCKGQRTINGTECRACNGSGTKTSTKVAIRYQMGPNLIEEEWVTYILSPAKTGKDGTPQQPSTLFIRFKAISGLSKPDEIVAWFDALPKPIKVPLKMMLIEGARGYLEVAYIMPMAPRGAIAPPPPPAPAETFEDEGWPDETLDGDDVPF